MSTEPRIQRCSNCHCVGHNRRTCEVAQQVNAITKAIIAGGKSVSEKPDPPKCSICLECVDGGKDSMCLPCGHHLHVTCGLKWLQENNSCPCCRAEIGVKPKKQLKLTNEVIGLLIQERLNTTPINPFLQEQENIRHEPWKHPRFAHDIRYNGIPAHYDGEHGSIENFTPEDYKICWDGFSFDQRTTKVMRYLYELNVEFTASNQMNILTDASYYQEQGGFGLDLGAILSNDGPHVHNIQVLNRMDSIEDDDTDDDMPPLMDRDVFDEEELDNSSDDEMPPLIDATSELQPLNLTDLEVDMLDTLIDDVTDVVVTPPPRPQPSSPPRIAINNAGRANIQSPPPSPRGSVEMVEIERTVTRRSSARLRQRYRRRRLQEETERFYSESLEI